MPAPSSHAPAATHTTRGRLVWVDVARGLALVAMMVVHAAPADGPDGVLRLAEHLTAPLFAALVGVGARLEAERLGPRRSVPRALIRAAALCGAAWLTGHLGAEVTDVLAHLAVLTVLMALLAALPLAAHLVLAVLAGGGGLLLAATPTAEVVDRLLPLDQALGLHRPALTPWVSAFLTDGPFRLPLLLAWALLGAVLVATVHGTTTAAPARRVRLTGLGWAAGGIALAGVVLALSRAQTGAAPAPAAATPAEAPAEALLVTGLVLAALGGCAALTPPRAGLLAVPGAMTLSVYVAHLWYLGWVRRLGPGPWRSDTGAVDTWFTLAVLVAGALLLPLLWRAVVRVGPFRAGPLEGVVRLLTAPFDRAR